MKDYGCTVILKSSLLKCHQMTLVLNVFDTSIIVALCCTPVLLEEKFDLAVLVLKVPDKRENRVTDNQLHCPLATRDFNVNSNTIRATPREE